MSVITSSLLALLIGLLSLLQTASPVPDVGVGAQAQTGAKPALSSVYVSDPPLPPVLVPQPSAAAPALRPWASLPEVGSLAAVVLDDASGAVLYEKNAREPLPPASLTKIATAILALEDGDLDAVVEVDVDSSAMPRSTVMGLLPGDRFTLHDLLYGLLLPSGNDAAMAIGRHLAGSDAAFVARMNELAWRLGMRDTNFDNPHGLGSRNHLISAYDLAILTRYAMTVPGFAEIIRTPAWVANGSRKLAVRNINSFLFSYPGADSAKVGYTRSAGSTMAASASRGGHRLVVVVLNTSSREHEARLLMDWAFTSFDWSAATAGSNEPVAERQHRS